MRNWNFVEEVEANFLVALPIRLWNSAQPIDLNNKSESSAAPCVADVNKFSDVLAVASLSALFVVHLRLVSTFKGGKVGGGEGEARLQVNFSIVPFRSIWNLGDDSNEPGTGW